MAKFPVSGPWWWPNMALLVSQRHHSTSCRSPSKTTIPEGSTPAELMLLTHTRLGNLRAYLDYVISEKCLYFQDLLSSMVHRWCRPRCHMGPVWPPRQVWSVDSGWRGLMGHGQIRHGVQQAHPQAVRWGKQPVSISFKIRTSNKDRLQTNKF